MRRTVTRLTWLAVILLVAAAGVVEAKSGMPSDAAGKKDVPPGKAKDEPALPPAEEPQPDPAPAPQPDPAPAPVVAPPSDAPASSPAPQPEPALAEAPVPEAVEDAASGTASGPGVGTAPAAEPPAFDGLPEAVVPLAVLPPQESTIQGAAPITPQAGGVSLLWGFPLAGLLLLGIVLSSGRLVQPRPLPRPEPAPLAPAASAAPLVVAVRPRDVESLLRAAKAAVEEFRYEDAIKLFDQALRVNPKLAVAHFCRGVCLVGLRRDAEACAAFRKAHDLDPKEGAYRLELARACARLGRAAEAMDALGPLLHALPSLVEDVMSDPSFGGLLDHPRFLAMTGKL